MHKKYFNIVQKFPKSVKLEVGFHWGESSKTIAMAYSPSVNASTIQQWIAEKLNPQKIQEALQIAGCDEETIAAHLKEFKRLRYVKRQFKGFICLGAGAFLGFVSCVLTMINPVPELYNWILYGLTSVAMFLLFMGLYYIFE